MFNYGRFTHYTSFHNMTLKLKHPFTLIVAGPSGCGKSTSVIRLLECREQLHEISFENILWCHSESKAPHYFKILSFVIGLIFP